MRAVVSTLALALLASGCLGDADLRDGECDGEADDLVAGQNIDTSMRGLARSGRWIPPPDVMAVGDQQNVQYTGAPPFDGGANCSGGATPGATMLRRHLLEYFPQTSGIGVYNCRVIAGTNSMSLHGVGRALDIMIPTVGGDADNDLGDPIAHWLIENAEAIGIQTIIWDHTIWRTSYSPRQHALNAANPHIDHLHVELSVAGGRKEPSWYDDPFGPVPVTPFDGCEPLPATGGVVEEDGPCFELHGPSRFWRTETGVGSGGSLLWTNAFESTTASNSADWKLPVSSSGDYAIATYLDPAHAQFVATRYVLERGAAKDEVVVDQSRGDGWFELGTFALDARATNALHVYDNHDGAVGTEKRIAVDAVRLTPLGVTPAPETPPAPEAPWTPRDPTRGLSPPFESASADEETPVVDVEQEGPGLDGLDPSGGLASLGPNPVAGGCHAVPPDAPWTALLALLPWLRARRAARRTPPVE